jgi:hypothetical protein
MLLKEASAATTIRHPGAAPRMKRDVTPGPFAILSKIFRKVPIKVLKEGSDKLLLATIQTRRRSPFFCRLIRLLESLKSDAIQAGICTWNKFRKEFVTHYINRKVTLLSSRV